MYQWNYSLANVKQISRQKIDVRRFFVHLKMKLTNTERTEKFISLKKNASNFQTSVYSKQKGTRFRKSHKKKVAQIERHTGKCTS